MDQCYHILQHHFTWAGEVLVWLSHCQWNNFERYHQNSIISRTFVGDEIVDHSSVVGVSPVGVIKHNFIWWRHEVKTYSALLAFCVGHWSPVNSPHKSKWRGALVFSLICDWTNCCAHNGDARDLRRHRTHYDVTVMTHHFNLNSHKNSSIAVACCHKYPFNFVDIIASRYHPSWY